MNRQKFYQLTLFREINDSDIKTFRIAEKAKAYVQKIYNDFDFEHHKKDICLVQFKTNISQVRDEDRSEPDTPKLFIRKIISSHRIKGFDDLIKDYNYKHIEERIIPKWAHYVYSENVVSIEKLLELCRQIYGMEYAINILSNENLINSLKLESKTKEIILYFDHGIQEGSHLYESSANVGTIINRRKNAYDSLKSIAIKESFYLLGRIENFTETSALLKEIDRIINKRNVNYLELFATDYLFLNNAEFVTQYYNTFGWPEIILQPSTFIIKNNQNTPEESFFFVKENEASKFFKFELFSNHLKFDQFLNIANFAKNIFGDIHGEEPQI